MRILGRGSCKSISCMKDFVNNDNLVESNHNNDLFLHEEFENVLPHAYLINRKVGWSVCNSNMQRHCSNHDKSKSAGAVWCKKIKFLGINYWRFKDKNAIIEEIIEKAHGGSYTFAHNCSLTEI